MTPLYSHMGPSVGAALADTGTTRNPTGIASIARKTVAARMALLILAYLQLCYVTSSCLITKIMATKHNSV